MNQPTPTDAELDLGERIADELMTTSNGSWYRIIAQALAAQRTELGAHQEADLPWQWGVKHSQGIRQENSERNARQVFEEMSQRRRRHGVIAPSLVRRRVGGWESAS